MEIFLWFILWAAFVLPVTKCFMLEVSTDYYQAEAKDNIFFGIFWPISVPGVVFGTLVEVVLLSVFGWLSKLVED